MKRIAIITGIIIVGLAATGFVLLKKYTYNPPVKVNPYLGDLPLDKLKIKEGFGIEVWAEDVDNARSMDYSPEGTLYVGTRGKGNVYAFQDTNGDGKSDKKYLLMKGGNMPNGVAYRDGALYVAEVNRILKWSDIESKLDNPGEPEVVFDGYPTETHHGWKYINFGPDGKLYVPVGAPCNICESEDQVFNTITRINPDGTGMEIVQEGVRNTVGFDWHPETGELWFTDNGRDWLGDEKPECELNRATQDKMHFGYPYCHQGDIADPEFGDKRDCGEFTAPAQLMGPHTAPLGMEFYTGGQFPQEYKNQAFIARHGSWNRKKKIGYDVQLAYISSDGEVTGMEPFVTGWLEDATDDVWGRPVDIELLPDGTMLISDDYADVIYRVYHKG